jgi:hypothetical protein
MLANLPSAYLKLAEKVYGRTFTNDDDLIHALKHETFAKRAEFLAHMGESLGYEFTSPLEVFRLVSGERLSEFTPLSAPPGGPTAFEVARKTFGRSFSVPKDLMDYISESPGRRGDEIPTSPNCRWLESKEKDADSPNIAGQGRPAFLMSRGTDSNRKRES